MILVAESGSTKTDWEVIDTDGSDAKVVKSFRTIGLNPNVLSFEVIEAHIRAEVVPKLLHYMPDIQEVAFYGASYSVPAYCKQMVSILDRHLGVRHIVVEHDLLGAARAAAGTSPALVCIVGTGSNSCYYDGQAIIEERGGNGYLFGDEGGGVDLGRRLIKGLLDQTLPASLRTELEAKHHKTLREIRNEVYNAPLINAKLASFAPFIAQNIHVPEVEALVIQAFTAFLGLTVIRYEQWQRSAPVHFVGSVGAAFEHQLRSACATADIEVGEIIAEPIRNLVAFHIQHPFHPSTLT